MKSHRRIQADLYDYLKNDLPEPQQRVVESHLSTCARCQYELAELRRAAEALAANAKRASDQRSDLYWQHFASKVVRKIESEESTLAEPGIVLRFLNLVTENRKAFGIGFASALSLVAIGFALWSFWPTSEGRGLQEQYLTEMPERAESRFVRSVALEARTREYLDQSKILLIGIMNTDPAGLQELKPLINRQRGVSKVLASESQSLAASLREPSQRRLRELVADLGVILAEISNLDADNDVRGIEIVRNGVERNGILFKINLEQMDRAARDEMHKGVEQKQRPTI